MLGINNKNTYHHEYIKSKIQLKKKKSSYKYVYIVNKLKLVIH